MLWLLIAVEYHFRHKRRSMESAKTMERDVNKRALYRVGALTFEVTIIDVRGRWGTRDVLISPVAGSGAQWVLIDRVKVL